MLQVTNERAPRRIREATGRGRALIRSITADGTNMLPFTQKERKAESGRGGETLEITTRVVAPFFERSARDNVLPRP